MTTISSNHYSLDLQIQDALSHMKHHHPAEYQSIIASYPKAANLVFDGEWIDTDAMGVDVEWNFWLADSIENCDAGIAWEEGEPWCLALSCASDEDQAAVQTMYKAYVNCALWATATCGEDGECTGVLENEFSEDDLSDEAREAVREEVWSFYRQALGLILEAQQKGYTLERCGHDLFLTRERHGAGFWDRGLGKLGDELTAMAHDMGGTDWEGFAGHLVVDGK